MPAPAWVSVPVPEMALATVIVFERLNASTALFTTLPEPSVPMMPPAPTCNVPAVMVVVPA